MEAESSDSPSETIDSANNSSLDTSTTSNQGGQAQLSKSKNFNKNVKNTKNLERAENTTANAQSCRNKKWVMYKCLTCPISFCRKIKSLCYLEDLVSHPPAILTYDLGLFWMSIILPGVSQFDGLFLIVIIVMMMFLIMCCQC